jgi:hypothetical protein
MSFVVVVVLLLLIIIIILDPTVYSDYTGFS